MKVNSNMLTISLKKIKHRCSICHYTFKTSLSPFTNTIFICFTKMCDDKGCIYARDVQNQGNQCLHLLIKPNTPT